MKGVAYDTPILGYRVSTCNPLRLWKAEAIESFDFAAFNQGDYYRAVESKMRSENITKVLYPNDEVIQGKISGYNNSSFRELLAAGHDPPASVAEATARQVPREVGDPAQRHAPAIAVAE